LVLIHEQLAFPIKGVVDDANSSIKKTKVVLKQLIGTNAFDVENE
jgi:hypothetical protein